MDKQFTVAFERHIVPWHFAANEDLKVGMCSEMPPREVLVADEKKRTSKLSRP
jgi:hypothetical protein